MHRVSSKVGVNDQALPWWHDWPGPLQWQCDGCFCDQQWREAGLRISPSPLQHLFHLYAVQDLEKGVYIHYRLDSSHFDLHRLTAKTKSLQTLLQEVPNTPSLHTITIDDKPLANVEHSKYLGSTISRGSSLPPLWLWDMDTVLQAYEETGALPHASSLLHPGNQEAGPHPQSEGPRSS